MKTLVVDGEPDVKTLFEQQFRREIKNEECRFAFAFSGEDAIAFLNKHEQEAMLVVADTNVPGMNGLEL